MHHHSWAELAALLESHGFEGEIIDVTPRMSGEPRGIEIATWLAAAGNESARYVVLDDEDPSGGLVARWVRTDALIGLQPRDVELAAAILSRA